MYTFFLQVADLAAVFDVCGVGLFVGGEIVPVCSCGAGCEFGVDVFAEDVAVEEDALVFLSGNGVVSIGVVLCVVCERPPGRGWRWGLVERGDLHRASAFARISRGLQFGVR